MGTLNWLPHRAAFARVLSGFGGCANHVDMRQSPLSIIFEMRVLCAWPRLQLELQLQGFNREPSAADQWLLKYFRHPLAPSGGPQEFS